ncbi:MAG TPA: hypothetical protein VN605_10430 [Thermoanaerobaculia bacterium]|nr:hypothetical protein [Thermoanaerobaculia bacterium]
MRYLHLPSRPVRNLVVSSFLALLWPMSLLAAAPAAAIRALVDGQHLRITGGQASGSIVIVAAIRDTSPTRPVFLDRVVRTLTGDAGGNADLDYGREIPVASIWAVVDQSSGSYDIVTPGDYPRREKPFTGSILKHATPAEAIDQLTTNSLVLQMLWVRPGNGGGSWFVTASDGAANDDDHEPNGETLTSTALFTPIAGKEKAPKKLKTDDVLILIDPFEMNFIATVVTR